jgi:hypothetical protein
MNTFIKTSLFLILIICFSSNHLYSQSSLIDTDKLWAVNVIPSSCYLFPHYTRYCIIGDTITITPYLYNEVLAATDSNHTNWSNYGYIRKDQEKYYYLGDTTTGYTDQLLYDFDVSTGDTINHYGMDLYAISVDSIFFAGQVRKRIRVTNCDTLFYENWYSGIGSDQGLIESGTTFFLGFDFELQCYWESTVLQYHNPVFNDCWDNTTSIVEKNNSEVLIYPNPTKNKLMVTIAEPSRIEILNQQGIILFESNNNKVNVSSLSKGIYLVRITNVKQTIIKKFIKE